MTWRKEWALSFKTNSFLAHQNLSKITAKYMVQLLEKLEFEKSFRLHQSHSLVSVPMRFESISICLKSLQICKTWLQSLKKACKQFPKPILQRRQRSLSVISQYFLQIFHRSNVILSGPFHSWYYSTVSCFSHIISNVKYF